MNVDTHLKMEQYQASDVVNILLALIDGLCVILDKLLDNFNGKRSSANDSSFSLPVDMDSAEHSCATNCLGHLLEIFYLLLCWFKNEKDETAKKKLLLLIVGHGNHTKVLSQSDQFLAVETASYFAKFVDIVPNVYCAKMVASIISLLLQSNLAQSNFDLFEMTLKLLNNDWDKNFEYHGHKFKDLLLGE